MNERKSTYSNSQGACAEVGQDENGVVVGDTKDPLGPRLAVDVARWRELLARLHA